MVWPRSWLAALAAGFMFALSAALAGCGDDHHRHNGIRYDHDRYPVYVAPGYRHYPQGYYNGHRGHGDVRRGDARHIGPVPPHGGPHGGGPPGGPSRGGPHGGGPAHR